MKSGTGREPVRARTMEDKHGLVGGGAELAQHLGQLPSLSGNPWRPISTIRTLPSREEYPDPEMTLIRDGRASGGQAGFLLLET